MISNLAVIDVCGANFLSVEMALKRLNINYLFTHEQTQIESASAVLLPGVGSAGYAMAQLKKYDLINLLKNYTKPLLGICLGMQLLYDYSEEDNVDCLGIIPGKIKKFDSKNIIVPHMGWHNMNLKTNDPIFADIPLVSDVYFVHSYYAEITNHTIASCNYDVEFTAIARRDNFYAMQFHPEKSGVVGAKLLKNFIKKN